MFHVRRPGSGAYRGKRRIHPTLEPLEERAALAADFGGFGPAIHLPSLTGPGQEVAELAALLASVDLPAIEAFEEASAVANALGAKDGPLTEEPSFGPGTPTHAPGSAAAGLVDFQSQASDGEETDAGEKEDILWHESPTMYGTGAGNQMGNVIESDSLSETKTGTREIGIYGTITGDGPAEVVGHEEHNFHNGRLVSVRREFLDGRVEWDDDPDPYDYYTPVYYPSDSEVNPIDWGLVTPPIQVVKPDSKPPGPLVGPVDPESLAIVHGENRSGILDWKQWSTQPPPEGETGGDNGSQHDPTRFVQPGANTGGVSGEFTPTSPEPPRMASGFIPIGKGTQ